MTEFDINLSRDYIDRMLLTIIVPIYNEEKTLITILKRLLSLPIEKQIIAVDDASSDRTPEILESFAVSGKIVVMHHDQNRGKGYAIRTGLEKAEGTYTVIQDADLEYEPDDIVRLLNAAREKNADAVFGSRIANPKSGKSYHRYYWGGRLLTVLANFLYGINITDESTCYKLIKTQLLKSLNLQCRRFEFCPEVVACLGNKKIKIYEIPISYFPRKIKDGKKIRWYDGAIAIWTLIKYRLFP
jgi:glycosyltransferase involved in cell wall biosynthesis